MLFAIIWAVFVGIAFLVAIIRDEAYKKKRERELQIFRNNIVTMPKHPEIEFIGGEDYYSCFPVIWNEPTEEYQLILWLRYDIEGLRLNDDGSFEWIRKNQKSDQLDYSYYNTMRSQTGLQNAICNTDSLIQSQIHSLQMAQLQAAQTAQMQNIINSIQPLPYPMYPTYSAVSPYMNNTALTWTCCGGINR